MAKTASTFRYSFFKSEQRGNIAFKVFNKMDLYLIRQQMINK